MFSFGHNSFWNFSFQGSAAVQSLLEKSDLTLDDLLEEDGLLTELKTLNQKLFDFLLTEETFKQLISYVIHEPNPEDIHTNSKRCFKYPFTCADVLGSDSQAILSEFFKSSSEIKEKAAERARKAALLNESKDDEVNLEDPESAQRTNSTSEESPTSEDKENQIPTNQVENFEFLDYLFTFLDKPEVNYTAAGYFAKIVNNLYAKKPSIFLSYIYESRPDLLEKMVNHISSKSIAEFLAKLLTFESSLLANNDDETYNTERIKILNLVVRKLDPKNDVEMINNSAYLVCETFGKYNTMHCGREVLSSLLTDQTISYFFGILEARNSVSSCAVALILGNIFAYYILISTSRNYEESQEYYSQSPTMGELKDDLPLIVALLGHIPSIINYLGENQGSSITNQCGTNIIPFGGAKLKLIELLIIALKTGNQKIHAKLAQSGFVETLLELFLRFEWNNMLHNQVEKVLTFIIEGNSEELKVTLFEKADILGFLINATRQSEYDMSGKHGRKVRKGYMGQVVRLSNKLVESRDDYIMDKTNNSAAWKEYLNTELAETNKKDKINLGGRDPRGHFQDDDEEDYDNLENHDPLNRYYGATGDNDRTFGKDYQDQDDDDKDDKDEDEDKENDDEDDDEDEEPRNLRDSYSRLSGVQILHKEDDDEEEIEEEVVVVDDEEDKNLATSEYQVVHAEEESTNVPQVEEVVVQVYKQEKPFQLKEEERVQEEKLDNEYSPSVFFKVNSSISLEDIMNEFQ